MSKENLKGKELSDEELDKVAGGKDWDADDLEKGQAFLVKEAADYDQYYQIYNIDGNNVIVLDMRYHKGAKYSYEDHYQNFSTDQFLHLINSNQIKNTSLPC